MKIEKKDGSIERRVLIAMIVNKHVLGKVAPRWDKKDGLFKSRWANQIGHWCVRHYEKYSDCPGKTINAIFERWAVDHKGDKDTTTLVERFLVSLSDEYQSLSEDIQVDHMVDLAADHFNKTRLLKIAEDIQDNIHTVKSPKLLEKVEQFSRIEMGTSEVIDVLFDKQAIMEAFDMEEESIIKFPGALGEFFGSSLEREGFVAFEGPDKTGKSWWLMELAWMGMLQRRRVAFFEVGDMTRRQIMRRFMVRASGRPRKPKLLKIPTKIFHDVDSDEAECEFKEREFKRGLDWKTALKACNEVMEHRVKSKESYLKLSCHPNSTINVKDMNNTLDRWERDDWVPDVVVVDYADILAPMHGQDEHREQINKTWKALRAMSQERHCLVVTATQCKASGYATKLLTRKDFSDDKRKMAHVTMMVGINVTDLERQNGQCRLNQIVLRDDEFVSTRCVHCVGNLALARPVILSTW